MASVDPLQSAPPGRIFLERFNAVELIGAGGFGFVLKAIRKSDGMTVACKLIVKRRMARDSLVRCVWDAEHSSGLDSWTDGTLVVPREAYVLRLASHESVVNFVDLFADETYFYLAMEHHGSPWEKPAAVEPMVRAPPTPPLTPEFKTFPLHIDTRPVYRRSPSRQSLKLTTLDSLDSPTSPTSTALSSAASSPSPLVRRSSPLSHATSMPMSRRSSSSDLFECIEQHNRFSEGTARFIFAQITTVVADLRYRGICHRDIKDENLVVDSAGVVKLIDFGSAILFDPSQPLPKFDRFYGTASCAPAEVLSGQPFDLFAAEVWSLGILLCTLLTGCAPFANREAAMRGRRSKPSSSQVRLTREAEDLIDACFIVDPLERITLTEILVHPWMRKRA